MQVRSFEVFPRNPHARRRSSSQGHIVFQRPVQHRRVVREPIIAEAKPSPEEVAKIVYDCKERKVPTQPSKEILDLFVEYFRSNKDRMRIMNEFSRLFRSDDNKF